MPELTCVQCLTPLLPSFKYCSHCGKCVVMGMRSENEVKLLKKEVEDYFMSHIPSDPGGLLMNIMKSFLLHITLSWVLGEKTSPLEMIKSADKTISENKTRS